MQAIEISNAVLFLASNEARCIIGVALPVDAGMVNQSGRAIDHTPNAPATASS